MHSRLTGGSQWPPPNRLGQLQRSKREAVLAQPERTSISNPGPVLHWHTMGDRLEWLPDDGVVLTREDLERILRSLRARISLEPNRSHAVDVAITQALERESGGD